LKQQELWYLNVPGGGANFVQLCFEICILSGPWIYRHGGGGSCSFCHASRGVDEQNAKPQRRDL